jgi:hypothetical protein
MESEGRVMHRKMRRRARQLPITGSAHKTAVVGDADQAAVIALLDMTAERRGPARLDGSHDAALLRQEPPALRSTECIAVAAEDVRHLQRGTHGAALLGRNYLDRERVERARCPGDQTGRDLRIAGRRLQMGMPEQDLDNPDVRAVLQKMRGKAVPPMSPAT